MSSHTRPSKEGSGVEAIENWRSIAFDREKEAVTLSSTTDIYPDTGSHLSDRDKTQENVGS